MPHITGQKDRFKYRKDHFEDICMPFDIFEFWATALENFDVVKIFFVVPIFGIVVRSKESTILLFVIIIINIVNKSVFS